nr:ulp1 protease family, C-terminal catalytic domain-containing protein [Ipomoea batatas]
MPATTVSAPSVGDVQGPYASDPEVQPQHQTPIQVELECSASSKFFVPIIAYEHIYMICMNVKNSRIDIIDNSTVEQPIDVKYGTIPGVLVPGPEGVTIQGNTT